MSEPKPILMLWSQAAFEACESDIATVQDALVAAIADLASRTNGWFFHTLKISAGMILRCDVHPESEAVRVFVRLAELQRLGEAGVGYPAIVEAPANERFAEYSAIEETWLRRH